MSDTINPQKNLSPKGSSSSVPEQQETTRSWLAKGVFILSSAVIIGILLSAIFSDLDQNRLSFLLSLLSAITGTLGFVMGFYFGQNQK